MSRPQKTTVDYFPHFVTNGKTMYSLEASYGNDGYAFWFKLLELLGKSENHFYDCNKPCDWRFLLAKTKMDENTANNILDLLVDLEAIDRDLWEHRIIWSANFVENLSSLYSRRNVNPMDKPAIMGLCIQKPPVSGVSVGKNPQSKGEESIGEESIKEKNTKKESPVRHKYGEYKHVMLTDSDVFDLQKQLGADYEYMLNELDKGIEMKGYKYKNHKLAMLNWYKKELEQRKKRPQTRNERSMEFLKKFVEEEGE